MSILNRLLGTAQTAARSQASGRTGRPVRGGGLSRGLSAGRGMSRGAAGRPMRRGYGRPAPTTSASGIAGLVGGLLRRR